MSDYGPSLEEMGISPKELSPGDQAMLNGAPEQPISPPLATPEIVALSTAEQRAGEHLSQELEHLSELGTPEEQKGWLEAIQTRGYDCLHLAWGKVQLLAHHLPLNKEVQSLAEDPPSDMNDLMMKVGMMAAPVLLEFAITYIRNQTGASV